jgi:DnaA family protein
MGKKSLCKHPGFSMSRQLALAVQLNDEATLADFCWGNNSLLQQQLIQTLNGEGERLIYIWGTEGSGKSHLLQACCQAVNTNQSAVYLPLKTFREWSSDVLEGMDEQTWICIDDLEVIATDTAWEEALFHLYNRIRDNGRTTLLISGNQAPVNMPIRLQDLRSRLGWGLVVQLNELSDEDKIKTLKLHASKRGLMLPTSVGQFLLNRCARNMHDLSTLLNRLDEASLMAQRKITIPFVKDVLEI